MNAVVEPSVEKVYRASGPWRVFIIGGGALLGLGGVAGMVYFGRGNEVNGTADMWMMVGLSAALALLGVCSVAYVLRDRLVLAADYVERRGLLGTRRLRVADIDGYRMLHSDGVDLLQLMPRSGAGKRMDITLVYERDEHFRRWLDSLVDLDAREAKAALAEVATDTLLGYSQAEREQNLDKARKGAGVMSAIAFAVTGWAVLYPQPYEVALLAAAALPLIAIALAWTNAAYTLRDSEPGNVRGSLFFAVLMPGFALLLRAIFDVQLIDVTPVVVAALAGGAVLALLCGAHKKNALTFVLYSVLLGAYPGGALPLANALLDRAEPDRLPVVVQSRHISSGKTSSYYVAIAPAVQERTDAMEVQVSRALYDHLEPGAAACLSFHPGALKMAWIEIERASACGPDVSR